METKKNLLLFFPYKFSIEEKIEFDTMANGLVTFSEMTFKSYLNTEKRLQKGLKHIS